MGEPAHSHVRPWERHSCRDRSAHECASHENLRAPGDGRILSRGYLALLGAAVAIGAVLFFFNPSTTAFYPKCLFHELTGLYCPGCGTTRALYFLLHGSFLQALQNNALVIFLLPVLGATMLWRSWRRRPPSLDSRFRSIWIVVLLAVVVVFGVLRNLPARPFCWLAPLADATEAPK
jgi:hypothetical protein